jgi:aryl-alcohol dehydrogenase-like predicted oxidoreductase
MEYRKLGLTDIKVSLICLGTMTWGEQNTEEQGHAQMDYAVEQGINFFDTAEMYAVPPSARTFGRTEEIIGSWFKKSGRRKDIILATKVAGPAPAMPWIRDGKASLTPAQIARAAEGSLKRLGTDVIDLYQVHWPERPVNTFGKLGFEEAVTGRESDQIAATLEGLQALVKAGKVRHIGLSNETPWGVMTYLKHHAVKGLPRVQSIQNPYNLLNRTFEVGLAEMALQEKVGLLAYSPLGGGTLTGKYLGGKVPPGTRRSIDTRKPRYLRPRADEAVEAYLAIAKKYGLDAAQMALAFVNTRPFLASNIIGATSMEQLKTNIGSIHVKLPDEAVREIQEFHNKTPNPCP